MAVTTIKLTQSQFNNIERRIDRLRSIYVGHNKDYNSAHEQCDRDELIYKITQPYKHKTIFWLLESVWGNDPPHYMGIYRTQSAAREAVAIDIYRKRGDAPPIIWKDYEDNMYKARWECPYDNPVFLAGYSSEGVILSTTTVY